MTDTTIKDFEAAIAELETIVKKLEEGDLPLETSLKLYERGVQLSRFCHAQLEDAEKRIEILNERGGLRRLHVVAGEGMAILAGDGLLTEAFALMAREPAGDDPALAARRLRVIGAVAAAAGACGMVGGQAIDLSCVTPRDDGAMPT